jgi:release factor glutamine methyltransferase
VTKSSSAPKVWRLLDLIQWGTQYLTDKQISNARLEVEWLLAHQLGVNRVDLYVAHDRPLTPEELAGFKALIRRRVSGVPFQYILGKAPFYGHDFHVSPAVLIPRPESETLIQVLRKGNPPTAILDIGTGSGCLAVTAALLYPDARVLAVDNSPEALDIARGNARSLAAENVTFEKLDILTDCPEDQFDAILCNPPYVAADDVPRLQREIREHEPPLAFTDQADGLTYYRRLAQIGSRLLTEEGRLLVEIGGTPQAEPVRMMFEQPGYAVTLYKDLQGDERIISVRWNR